MDVLDKYKESWKNQPDETNKVSKVDIYKMSHKKSTSIVKWIFIIGIIEFVFFFSLQFLPIPKGNDNSILDSNIGRIISIATTVIGYLISFYFLYHFYMNYKNISIADNTKTLMDKIVKTRKTVKQFINLNLILFFFITSILTSSVAYKQYIESDKTSVEIITVITMCTLIILFVFIPLYLIIKVYYHLLYGRLLDKLYYNHKELSKLETE